MSYWVGSGRVVLRGYPGDLRPVAAWDPDDREWVPVEGEATAAEQEVIRGIGECGPHWLVRHLCGELTLDAVE